MTTERTDDPLIAQAEEAEAADPDRAARAANLFDVRRLIGGLFAIYGVILTIMGITASKADIRKAAGINLNLWVGIGMLIVAALFLFWAFSRPLAQELDEDGDDEQPEGDRTVRGAHAPVGADAASFAGSETTRRKSWPDRQGTGGDGAARR